MNSPRCIVLSDHGDDKLARSAYACLASVRELELFSERLPQSAEAIPSADVLVAPVEAAAMQRTLRDAAGRDAGGRDGTPSRVLT